MPGRLFTRLAHWSGYRILPMSDSAWILQSNRDDERPLRSRPVDGRAWLVEAGPGRRLRRVGPPALQTHLLVAQRKARGSMGQVQQSLSEYLAIEQAAWMLRELDVNCVLDVGANRGQYARSLRRVGYTGRIVSFEPLDEFVELLEAEACDDPDWLVYDCALGAENTEAEINVSGGTMSSLLESSAFGKRWSQKLREMTPETIQIRRLDAVFDEATAGLDDPRVYLKMDTQGYDLQTFRGAGERIDKVLGMQSELSCVPIYEGMPRLPEQLTEYEAAGFEVAGMFQVSRHSATLRIIEFDVMMVRAGAVKAARLARAG